MVIHTIVGRVVLHCTYTEQFRSVVQVIVTIRSCISFRVRQIFAFFRGLFPIRENWYTQKKKIVMRVPQIGGLWTFSLLLLDYGTAVLL